jgi:hypothetical protein
MNQQDRAVWEKVVELLEENREYIEANERPEYLALYDKGIADANALLMQPAQEPKFAPYWAVTDMEGKHIKVNADTQRLEIYEEKCWARANVRSNTKAMLVYITKTPPAQPADHIRDATEMVRPQNCGTGYCSCIECPFKKGGA